MSAPRVVPELTCHVHGVRLRVLAADERLLRGAAGELPARRVGEGEAERTVTFRLGSACPVPPAPLRAGSVGLDYLLDYPELWLRTPGGTTFHAHLERGVATVDVPPHLRGRAEAELAAGMGLLLPYLLREAGLWSVHAGGVYADRRAVLLAGPSGSGKSTTTALLVQTGMPLLADDLVLLAPAGDGVRVLPYPAPLRLCGPALAWLKDAGGDPSAGFAADYGSRPAVEPGLLLFPSIRDGAASRAERLTGAEALRRLIGGSLLLGGPPAAGHARMLARLARASRCYALHLAPDIHAIPHLIHGLLAAN